MNIGTLLIVSASMMTCIVVANADDHLFNAQQHGLGSGTQASTHSQAFTENKAGTLNVLQTENDRSVRNDRVMVVPARSSPLEGATDTRRLPASLHHQAEEFLTAATAEPG